MTSEQLKIAEACYRGHAVFKEGIRPFTDLVEGEQQQWLHAADAAIGELVRLVIEKEA